MYKTITMENSNWLNQSMDDVVFEGRNKAYGAFLLRRLYDKHMTLAMIAGMLFFMLAVFESTKPPLPKPPATKPPTIKNQIQFVPPVVVNDDFDIPETSAMPTVDQLVGHTTGSETISGEDGVEGPLDVSEPSSMVGTGSITEPEDPFTYVEQMPAFPEGTEAMYKYIYSMIKYPALARENGISGKVVVQFVVTREGNIQNARVVSRIGGGCDEEALRVINGMPRWKPGMHNGRAVPVTFTLPIKFVLE
jgi:protein TonB